MIRAFLQAVVFLLAVSPSGSPLCAGAPDLPPIRVWCQMARGWLEARGCAVWLIVDGRSDRRLLQMRGRIVDLSISAGRRPLIALALDDSPKRAVAVARFTPAVGRSRPRVRLLGGGVEPHRRPWRVSWGDVDGDGREELLVGVIGRARFDPAERKRPFVYAWDGRRLVPKWLGSRLSRPITDVELGNTDDSGPSDLVALEATRDGGLEVAVYDWKGFGFERRFASSRITGAARLGRSHDGRILLDAGGRLSRITVDGAGVVISPTESP